VELLRLGEAVVPEDLNVAEHGLDGLLLSGQLPLNLLAVVLRVLRMEVVDPLGLCSTCCNLIFLFSKTKFFVCKMQSRQNHSYLIFFQ
jgi:hypothetical protein